MRTLRFLPPFVSSKHSFYALIAALLATQRTAMTGRKRGNGKVKAQRRAAKAWDSRPHGAACVVGMMRKKGENALFRPFSRTLF